VVGCISRLYHYLSNYSYDGFALDFINTVSYFCGLINEIIRLELLPSERVLCEDWSGLVFYHSSGSLTIRSASYTFSTSSASRKTTFKLIYSLSVKCLCIDELQVAMVLRGFVLKRSAKRRGYHVVTHASTVWTCLRIAVMSSSVKN
jgi:hypothetical protein